MKKRQLIELLADHAEALNRVENDGRLDTAAWLADYESTANQSPLLVLLQLAQAVKRALVPIQPSALFQSELRMRLAQASGEMAGKRPFPRSVQVGAIAGLVGLLLLVLRLVSNRSRAAATAV
ncbi:MAG: hypothetical protein GY803_31355 [Chloroflexi bacterium]|nr:hypothetical protein [Chloroflexota bacterium]